MRRYVVRTSRSRTAARFEVANTRVPRGLQRPECRFFGDRAVEAGQRRTAETQDGDGERRCSAALAAGDSIRLQILHTIDYRKALANPSSADERKRGRDLSRAITRDVPVARDLAANLLDTVDRLSAGRDAANSPVAASGETPPATIALPPRGAP